MIHSIGLYFVNHYFLFVKLFRENEKRFVFQDFLTCAENDADTLFDCFVSTINVKVE